MKVVAFISWVEGVRDLPHWALFTVGILAGIWLFVATSLQSLKRARKGKGEMGENARLTLRPEIENNIALVEKMRKGIGNGATLIQSLEVRAWERISARGYLFGLGGEEIKKLFRVYALVYRANLESNRLFDRTFDNNSAQVEPEYLRGISAALDELQPALEDLRDDLDRSSFEYPRA